MCSEGNAVLTLFLCQDSPKAPLLHLLCALHMTPHVTFCMLAVLAN